MPGSAVANGVVEFDGPGDLLALAAQDPRMYPCLLESTATHPRTGRYEILFALDRERSFELPAGSDARAARAFLDRLDRDWRAAMPTPGARMRPALPFRGGWALFLSYEMARACEPTLDLPDPPVPCPMALALRAPAAIVRDRMSRRTWLVAEPGEEPWIARMAADLARAGSHEPPPRSEPVAWHEDAPGQFLAGVSRVLEYLRDGDTFQVNLSRAWQATTPAGLAPAAIHASLREANPAPFGGLLQWGDFALASSSPERLVQVEGTRVETRPIAGTRPRLPGDDDRERVRELVGHPKERAEHVMLLDLERNDLGRVCVPGSVLVDELMTVESYAHVHHIVSNVTGTLRPGVTPGEVIRAVFPGGTITGCPKVRCMQIIAELEGEGRGPYTGSLGYLNIDGDMDLNILIRTLWLQHGVARLRAGGGIVADSVPERELDETRAKARGVLKALA